MACERCQGSGVDPEPFIATACCGKPLPNGECCGQPVPELEPQPCAYCQGYPLMGSDL